MKSVKHSIVTTAFVFAVVNLTAPGIAEANVDCYFNSRLDSESYSYTINVTSDLSCKSKLLQITAYKDGNPHTQLIKPYEAIVEKILIVDIDDDGKHELMIMTHDPLDESKKNMDLYAVDGPVLKPVRFPAPPDMTGYRGGDRFRQEGVRIVRVFPVYLPRDVKGVPTGGERTVVYQYRNKEIFLGSASAAARKIAYTDKDIKGVAGKIAALNINGIIPKSDYIEIQSERTIDHYKVTRINDPWRLIVDIPGANLGFQEKTVVINRHGIATARIGEHKGFIRIVLDATITPMPTETVTPAENGLRIGFYINTQK